MRTLIDIPDRMAEALGAIGARRRVSRASLVREALSEYLDRHGTADRGAAFGLWGRHVRDGLAWQRKIRAEW
jgi:metal-responsive CopG/Arc/MetJ family transcriptional regulator